MGKRPSIPYKVQFELWARAAGRCEFRGCNKLVFRDALTKKASNLSVVSHIVAVSPDGPRGDAVRSPLLITDISNLMLTCREHGKLIDDKQREAEYPEDLLQEFKNEHEERIQRLTGITADAQTRIVIVQSPVNGRQVTIRESDVVEAILPRYPADEHAHVWSLNDFGATICSPRVIGIAGSQLETKVEELQRIQQRDSKHLSLFALAPIPLLVLLGRRLGDLCELDAYQRHRTTHSWAWPVEEKPGNFYEVVLGEGAGSEAAVMISISGEVDASLVATHGPFPGGVFEIRAKRRGVDFLKSRARLDAFALASRDLMRGLHERRISRVSVFAAVPSPAAIEFGRAARLMNGELVVYEYDEGARSYGSSLTVGA